MNNVTYRETKLFQSDDGRKIEQYKKVGKVKFFNKELKSGKIEEQDFPIDQEITNEILYVGMVQISTPIGVKEIKFEIKNSSTIEQAFNNFYTYAEDSVKLVKQQISEQQKKKVNNQNNSNESIS